ncbi:arylsulfatase [Leptospira yanagawae serovar Saopaulo str. Sao Paulo = ATCC 700523]|uniref:Arylsulfatase n=1 Tax=Leptospira yanagawae serovar Saopaulo str. Sao Paulo = ATCC 700523 TaxID=1249483 RepID=A0A5E8H7P6_9LEPT|nr:alkaline phosphatase family protein [Leptospira yanagawae]EOQ87461.1 arylsulfatase [Leptospira yanagawae serovar Saopaulo str. Sao Paulo = ATCC 700523]
MKKFFSQIPFYIRFHLLLAGLGIVFLTIYRAAFFLMYSYRIHDKSIWIILKAFVKGARFDLSVLCVLLGFSLVYSSLHFFNRNKWYRAVWRTIPVVFMILLLFLLIADLIYYENGNKHLGYEAFAYLGFEMLPLVGSAFSQNPLLFLFGLVVIASIGFGIYKIQSNFPYSHVNLHYKWAGLQFLLVLALLVLGIRGGVQTSPLRTSDAIITKETIINDLVLNPGFTVITDLKMTKVDDRHYMKLEEATSFVRKEVAYPGAEFVSEEYPLLRKTTVSSGKQLPHIVVVVLEGWTGKFIDIIGTGKVEGKVVTPHFNQLIRQGMFFKHFFASGGRTTNGLMALMGGIPDRPGLTAVRTPQILNRFSGLGNIAKTIGYETLFVTGTDLSFNNKGSIMYHWGFDTLVGKQDLEKNPEYKTGPWSYLDEASLDAMHKRLLNVNPEKPIVSVIHTGTTHYPYKVPDEKYRLFGKDTQDSEYLNVLHYADFALFEYMEKAKKAPYFKDTIFFFVSDHSHHRFLNYYEDRNVPLLIYAPGKIKPEIREDITSQLDLIPTILGFMEREVFFSVMGRDLRKVKGTSAYFAYGNIFGWIEGDFLYYQSVTGGQGETKTIKEPFVDIGLCYQDLNLCKKHAEKTKAYLNLGDELLKSNKLFPSESALKEIKSNTKY